MILIILGILGGIGLTFQTSINTELRKKVGAPCNASLVSFIVALLFLVLLLIVTGQGICMPLKKIIQEPLWIWSGGICGAIFATGNVLLLAKIGSVQTVILPVLGQILMGLVIDSFGLFYVEQSRLTVLHATGAVFVAAGVLVVSRAKDKQQNKSGSERQCFLLWRIFGVIDGMLSTIQIAVNGYLGKVVDSPMKASAISFATGIIFLGITCIVIDRKRGTVKPSKQQKEKHPWWIWFGGILGSLYILANVTLSSQMGTGMTVIILLMGTTTGGLLVDHFGLFGTDKKPVNVMKVLGVLIMIAGAAVIKLF